MVGRDDRFRRSAHQSKGLITSRRPAVMDREDVLRVAPLISSWRDYAKRFRDDAAGLVSVGVLRNLDVIRRRVLTAAVHVRARG